MQLIETQCPRCGSRAIHHCDWSHDCSCDFCGYCWNAITEENRRLAELDRKWREERADDTRRIL